MEPVEEREKEVGNSSGRTEGEEAARASGDDDDDVIEIGRRGSINNNIIVALYMYT